MLVISRVLVLVPLLTLRKENKRPHLFRSKRISPNIKTSLPLRFLNTCFKFIYSPRAYFIRLICYPNLFFVFRCYIFLNCVNSSTTCH